MTLKRKTKKVKRYAPGRVPSKGMLGKRHTLESREKMSKAVKARVLANGFTEEHRAKMSAARMGREPWNKGKRIERMSGENHHNWKGGVTSQVRRDRIRFARTVSPAVFERDDYTCQVCDVRGGHLHADHIKSWEEFPELRFKVDNCRTLCRPCHYYVTFKKSMPSGSKWGMSKNRQLANNVL